MRRFKFGPKLDSFVIPTPAVSDSGKADPEVTYKGQPQPGIFEFEVQPYDLTTHNRLVSIHAVFVPEGQLMPSAADGVVGSAYPQFAAGVAEIQDGGTVSIDANGAPPGNYAGIAVLELEDEE